MNKLLRDFVAGSAGLLVAISAFLVPAYSVSAASVFIQGLTPGSSVDAGNQVYFTIGTTGFNSSLTYSASDSVSGSSISSSNIVPSTGMFVWTPSQSDVGVHTITITVSDQSGVSANTTQTITVTGQASVSIQSVSPGTSVNSGTTITFTATAVGFTSPTYTVRDSNSNTTLTNSAISSSGSFSWTPAASDVGGHTITVSVTDSAGHSASASQTFTVNASGSTSSSSSTTNNSNTATPATLIASAPIPSSDIAPGTTVTFSAFAYGFSSPTFTISDSKTGSSIRASNISSAGAVSWTPATADLGTHNFTITASDSTGRSASTVVQVIVSTTGTTAAAAVPSVSPAITTTAVPTPTPISSTYQFTSYLAPGSKGAEVTALQNILVQLGYLSGSATGYYGSQTQAAVVKFQNARGLSPLGVVGPQTRSALNSLSLPTASSQPSTSVSTNSNAEIAAQIAALRQQLLNIEAALATLQARLQ